MLDKIIIIILCVADVAAHIHISQNGKINLSKQSSSNHTYVPT